MYQDPLPSLYSKPIPWMSLCSKYVFEKGEGKVSKEFKEKDHPSPSDLEI
jgi:hypothetical protein